MDKLEESDFSLIGTVQLKCVYLVKVFCVVVVEHFIFHSLCMLCLYNMGRCKWNTNLTDQTLSTRFPGNTFTLHIEEIVASKDIRSFLLFP